VEAALGAVLRLDPPPTLTVAGRTDSGVHATGQVAHLDLASGVLDTSVSGPAELTARLNGALPVDVRVRSVALAPDGFDARFSALDRTYRYRIADRVPDPLRRRDTLYWPRSLDIARMSAAADGLVGEHDFAAYCRRRVGASTVRRIRSFSIVREADEVVVVTVAADAFCHCMVRALVGALLAVGTGRQPVAWPAEVLARQVRDSTIQVAPPHGLTLASVCYPADPVLAHRAEQTRRPRGPLGSTADPGGRL